MYKLSCLLFFFITLSANAQNSIIIKGKVHHKATARPVEEATVYLTSVKDSSVIDYTISDKLGVFKFETKRIKTPFCLKVSYLGYQTYIKTEQSLLESKDFGTISIQENENVLNEVVIKKEAPPVRIKNDTLEFNASSFKVRPDSNVMTLLKQLPGVAVDAEGKITINGKEVNQILVNGKPFFDKDGKIALQNLPSDIINKVQVTDTKTKKEEQSGQAASSNNASINLTIDEDKNKGFFGKFTGGYGTQDRYESSALVNYFKNKTKISLLASSNNINSSGFSMNEVFDSMGGGRNMSYYSSDNGSFGVGNMRFGGGTGITQSSMIGLNYSDQWGKSLEGGGSYFFTNSNNKNANRSKVLNILPTGEFSTVSQSDSNNDATGHNLNYELVYKLDSTTTFTYMPKFSRSENTYTNTMRQYSKDAADVLLNESNSYSVDKVKRDQFGNGFVFNKAFKTKRRNLSFSFDNEHVNEVSTALNQSATLFYQSATANDIRDQIRSNKKWSDLYKSEIEFSEPLADSLSVRTGVKYHRNEIAEDRKANDFDTASGTYSQENLNLTNFLSSSQNTVTPYAGFNINKKSFMFSFSGGTAVTKLDNFSRYLGIATALSKNYVLPYLDSYLNLRFGKSKSIWISYSYDVSFPSADQILPVTNLANPLNTYTGNPNLDPNKYHYLYLSFNNYDTANRSGFSLYMGGYSYNNEVVAATTFDASGKRNTTYDNVSGTYTGWFGGNWSKSRKIEAHNFKVQLGMNNSLVYDKGFTNGILYDAKSWRLSPKASFTYEYGELLTINPSYSMNYNKTQYTNYVVSTTSNVLHNFKIETTNYWPKNWVFGNDFGYTYNSNIADGFKKDFYLWNTSLSYSFFGKKLTAKVKVYDLLNQNQSATRTISPISIRDEENTVLKRYAMFSLTYKIEKFGAKKKPASDGMLFY
jgi:hypothetical protein